jgi:hypothetical protein
MILLRLSICIYYFRFVVAAMPSKSYRPEQYDPSSDVWK